MDPCCCCEQDALGLSKGLRRLAWLARAGYNTIYAPPARVDWAKRSACYADGAGPSVTRGAIREPRSRAVTMHEELLVHMSES
eukprot:6207836-Pleurochrysis_carterae.AAC.1